MLINKKSGLSSFDSLGKIKKAFATGKVGHTGTLDKFATGLLLVLVGRAVKLNFLFENCTKEYLGTIRFGEETDTLDPEGAVIAAGPVPSREEVESVLGAFRGEILQAPPEYSALHINGRRAHELAREGKIPEMKKRPAHIHELEITSWNPPLAEIRVKVSAGTYIRSLARDIALACNSRAHLSALERTAVGPFRLEDELMVASGDSLEELKNALHPINHELFEALSVQWHYLDYKDAEDFTNGKPIQKLLQDFNLQKQAAAGFFKKSNPDVLLGVLVCKNGSWSYGHVFANN